MKIIRQGIYKWPLLADDGWVSENQIIKKLQAPVELKKYRRAGYIAFPDISS